MIWPILESRAKSVKEKFHLLEDWKTPKNHSEINWPLIRATFCIQYWLLIWHCLKRSTIITKSWIFLFCQVCHFYLRIFGNNKSSDSEILPEWLDKRIYKMEKNIWTVLGSRGCREKNPNWGVFLMFSRSKNNFKIFLKTP